MNEYNKGIIKAEDMCADYGWRFAFDYYDLNNGSWSDSYAEGFLSVLDALL